MKRLHLWLLLVGLCLLACVVAVLAARTGQAQPQPAVQIDPSEQYLATIDKLQGHLNLCIQDAAREQAARKRLQAEVEALKKEAGK